MRERFSGRTYFSFEQTEMAMKAQWINEWLDEGRTVLGQVGGFDGPQVYEEIDEAIIPRTDTIECRMKDGTRKRIYGYKCYFPLQSAEQTEAT